MRKDTGSSPARRPEMTFSEAIDAIIIGQSVTKLEWDNPDIYGLLKDGFLMLRKDDGMFYQWIISEGDLMGADWVVVGKMAVAS